jgi:stage III sporulation protein AG
VKDFLKMESLTQIYKKYRFVLLILLTGLVLLLLPDSGKKEKEIPAEEGEVFSLEETQRSMEEILGRIEGTGRLQLMLTLKSSSQLQLAEDQERSAGDSEMQLRQEKVTLNRGSGYEDVIVTRRIYPVYQGALVVCQGADNAAVRLAVTEAVAALTGLSSDRITVVKWKS